ncbi:MAG TPA: hypothetical protein PLP17_05840, partial [Oligoflexia bacterium]|nr:hypothetical protein [Oligoflexia bacterium]
MKASVTLQRLLRGAAQPVPEPHAAQNLAANYLYWDGWSRAVALVEALLELLPAEEQSALIPPLERLGTRLAFVVTHNCFAVRKLHFEQQSLARRALRQMIRIEVELLRRRAHGHMLLSTAFRGRLSTLIKTIRAARGASTENKPGPLSACLAELMIIGTGTDAEQASAIFCQAFREAPQQQRLRLVGIVRDTVAEAMENPWHPALGASEMAERQDLLQDRMERAQPNELGELLAESHPTSTPVIV